MVYVHFPFCKSFCKYCGFFSQRACPTEGWVDEVCAEAESRRAEMAASAAIDTLYFGGGTPSVLPSSWLGRIADACGGRRWREWTVEVNPDDVSLAYAASLRALGAGRVSMGVQSLDDAMLRWMNRRHDAACARRAFEALRSAGFDNISVDIIFGINGLEDSVLESTVREILAWKPEHISAYQLSLDEGSALGALASEGKYAELPDEACAAQYYRICALLAAAGYEHYEISNWALPGHRAVHNSAYWTRAPYVGLGPGAHSLDGNRRSWNSEDLSGWTRSGEVLSEEEIREERIMLGLRTADGIPAPWLSFGNPVSLASSSTPASSASFGIDSSSASFLASTGNLIASAIPGNLRIPEDRWFTADDIIASLI